MTTESEEDRRIEDAVIYLFALHLELQRIDNKHRRVTFGGRYPRSFVRTAARNTACTLEAIGVYIQAAHVRDFRFKAFEAIQHSGTPVLPSLQDRTYKHLDQARSR